MTLPTRISYADLAVLASIWLWIVLAISGLTVLCAEPFVPYLPEVNITPIFDFTPPVTNISLAGTLGENEWYTSSVTVTLSASDVGWGVDKTKYFVVREGTDGLVIMLEYKNPFALNNEGKWAVKYWSVDKAGNSEETKAKSVYIDKTKPEGSIVIEGGAQHTKSRTVTLTLTASDAISGVAMMRFNTDNGTWSAWEPFATTKSWELTGSDGTRNVYVQFKDVAGLASDSKYDSIILDTLPPSVSFAVANGTKTKAKTFTVNWTGQDAGLGVDRYEVRVDGGTWIDTGSSTTYILGDLRDGRHTLEVKALDKAGRSAVYALSFVVNTSPLGGPGYLEEFVLIIVIIAILVGLFLYWLSKRPKKPPAPVKLNVKAEPAEIVADGKSSCTITVELLDKKGRPAGAQADLEVRLSATSGRLVSPTVRIPRGQNSGTAVLVSSTEFGSLSVSAEAAGLEAGSSKVVFKEKPRFCMGCGSRMSVKDTVCQKCGASPSHFGGLETKTCHCGAVLPFTAGFCSECGAKQQPTKAGPG